MASYHKWQPSANNHPSEFSDAEENRHVREGPAYKSYTTPRSSQKCHVITRAVILVLCLLAFIFICVSFGVSLARVTFIATAPWPYGGTYFDVFMWKLSPQPLADIVDGTWPVSFAPENPWVNGGCRVLAILALICSIVSLVLSIVFLVCVCRQDKERQTDDDEREAAAQNDRRERERLRLEEEERRAEDGAATAVTPRRSFRSSMKPEGYYVGRENARRKTNFGLGVSSFVFLFLTFLFALIAFILCAVYVNGEGIEDLEDHFVFEGVDLGDAMEDSTERRLQAGFYMLLIAFLAALVALILEVIPMAAGWSFAGPHRVGSPKAKQDSDMHESEMVRYPPGSPYANGNQQYSYYRNGGDDTHQSRADYDHGPYAGYQREDLPPPANGVPYNNNNALRGIPVALPGPPVDTLNVQDEGNAYGYTGNSGNAKKGQNSTSEYVNNFYPGANNHFHNNGGGGNGGGGAAGGKSAA